jgi:hypothetical protein
MQLELTLYLSANQGLIISATQLMGIAGDNGLCFFSGLLVLMIPTGFLLFVWFLLFRHVRPSSRVAKVKWNEKDGEWVQNVVVAESEDTGDEETDLSTAGLERQRSEAVGLKGEAARKRKRPTRRGKGKMKVRARSSASDAGFADHEPDADGVRRSDCDAAGVRRSFFGRLFARAKSRALQSTSTDFHILVEPLLDGWHHRRLAWVGPAILLGIEYGLGLAMGFGAVASCESEQVPIPSKSLKLPICPCLPNADLTAALEHFHPRCVYALHNPLSAVRRHDIPNV